MYFLFTYQSYLTLAIMGLQLFENLFASRIAVVINNHVHNSIFSIYHQTFNVSGTWVDNKSVDYPDVVGASPVGAASNTFSFST